MSSPKTSSPSVSRALALVSESPADHPLPLKPHCPILPRRSSRLAAGFPDLHAPPPPALTSPEPLRATRRSPGFSLPLAEDGTSCPSRNLGRILVSESEQHVRGSARLQQGNSAGEDTGSSMSSSALCDSSSKSASKKLKRPLKICAPGMSLRRSPRFSASPGMAVQGGDGGGVSPEDEYADKCSRLKGQKESYIKSRPLEDKSLPRSPRLSLDKPTTENSCPKASPSITCAKLRPPQSGNIVPLSQDDSNIQTKLFGTPGEKSHSPRNKYDKPVQTQFMLHDPTCTIPLPRRSPRHTLAPENNIGNESVRNITTRVAHVGQLRRSPRHSTEGGETDVDLNHATVDGSNKYPSKKIKVSSQNFSTTLDEIFFIQSSEEIALVKADKKEDCHVSSPGLETTEKRNPLENKVSDSFGSIRRENKIYFFIGDPISQEEAQERWQWRYDMKSQKPEVKSKSSESDHEDEIVTDVKCHYRQAKVNGCIYSLGDCATIRGEGGKEHVGRIIEFFRTTEEEDYFRVQWFYRAEDTVLQDEAGFHNKKRLFYSKVENDNPVDCIIAKVKISRITPKFGTKSNYIPPSDFYYDMEYCLEYSSFCNLQSDTSVQNIIPSSLLEEKPYDREALPAPAASPFLEEKPNWATGRTELTVLDLFSGCGGMSTGLCLGAKVSSVDLLMRWSVDCDESACESFKLNHPETLVRNEAAEDFLQLLKEWEKLCKRYAVKKTEGTRIVRSKDTEIAEGNGSITNDVEVPRGEYEVGSLVDICYGDPSETGKCGLKFKVRWLGYSSKDDTWEPIEGLSKCQERIEDFVRTGYRSKILPLPGDVDVICGGPPCQGISGYNRFRNVDSPLDDERNRQIVVFMDIVQFLRPKFVLMENVTDILRFDNASLGRYALSRLVHMRYQARLGTIAAGSYGLPQFRLRVFLWGAHPKEMLPQFPLPTHDVIVRYWPPLEFERNTVAYNEGHPRELEKAAVLRDAISDLPEVTNHESREQISYDKPPETELQKFIRSTKHDMTGCPVAKYTQTKSLLYDHRPCVFSEDNYLRICQVPKRKGANFRDFPGLIVGDDNVVRRDNTKEPILLPSGKPMIPDFVFTFEQGKSKRPFGRLWWDETVPTVLTQPNCRNQTFLHPEQDRVLTIRECARLQGFPDYYRFCGTIKERYCQIGNAVAVPVARALGYSLGMAYRRLSGTEPNMILPPKFSCSCYSQFANSHSSAESPPI